MKKLKKIGAGVAGVGILLLALYLAAFLFVILLVVGAIFGVYVYFKSAPMRKEMAKRQAEYARTHQGTESGGTIEAEYVVVEDEPLDAKPSDRQ
jgi:ABC-type transport system involved in cytochrome bd biosynthesis fused ATPase/permease subunit